MLCVAPFAGAWIEISVLTFIVRLFIPVAPFAGAWIEIIQWVEADPRASLSLPSRERGLKYGNAGKTICYNQSLPSRERGLKFKAVDAIGRFFSSLPSRERGLKYLKKLMLYQSTVSRSLRGSVD